MNSVARIGMLLAGQKYVGTPILPPDLIYNQGMHDRCRSFVGAGTTTCKTVRRLNLRFPLAEVFIK